MSTLIFLKLYNEFHSLKIEKLNYYSLNKNAPNSSFKNAVVKGLAPDKGLYFPEHIKPLPKSFFEKLDKLNHLEIAFEAIKQFVHPDLSETILKNIIKQTLSFDFPVITLDDQLSVLELFHGPTMAFKDVGARFMANCLSHFNKGHKNEITVLVATSGDTGGAVAHGFLGVEGVIVVILYPKGKVSNIQEKQLTTLGQNITALEVNGTFDDCQNMVKRAFLDSELTNEMQLTSANSINVARWLPQMFYFIFAYKSLYRTNKNIVFSIPSGNFGNICAGMVAQKLGLPVRHFIASNNENNVVTRFLKTGDYEPNPTITTISNAMDVGNPSNFIRVKEIYKHHLKDLKANLSSYSFTDIDTKAAIGEIYKRYKYVADPHGAIGYLGAKAYLKENTKAHCVFLETAHPSKFLETVENVIKENILLPPQIEELLIKEKVSIPIGNYTDLKNVLLNKLN